VKISIIPVEGLPEVHTGDDIAALIVDVLGRDGLRAGDVVVIAHKIISKAEGRVVPATDKEELVISESARVLRRSESLIISETRHGFVCANAGIDASNVEGEQVVLLPLDPDRSARSIRKRLALLTGSEAGVIVSDTFGRAWRLGQTNIAIGVAGMEPFIDYRRTTDTQGREMQATRICIADELAGAAELIMGKARRIPVAIVRGTPAVSGRGSAAEIVRPPGEDLFR
jgi:coenzyme F420-0:L-glutamate ligase / coenzyme F420-1:gamma-L-glutamate ligase